MRYLNPLPADLGELMSRFTHVIVAELNLGQLRMLLRARYLVDAKGINKVRGQPFTINELVKGVKSILEGTVAVEVEPPPAPDVEIPAAG